MLKHSLLVLLLSVSTFVTAQSPKAYVIKNTKGSHSSYKKLIKACEKADVVFFGELHNNAISHWLQLELTKELLDKRSVILGFEMFEADNQAALSQYLNGLISEDSLKSSARLWSNYKTDYRPLVELAKEHDVDVVATNVPRRYASLVYKSGAEALDTLSAEELEWMSPLPFAYDSEVGSYKKMLSMGGGHGGENLPKAQALKDATMAHFIGANRLEGSLFIHFNGSWHSDFYEGILWHLKQTHPNLKVVTISTVSQASLAKLEVEHLGKADFIIVVDEDMTETY